MAKITGVASLTLEEMTETPFSLVPFTSLKPHKKGRVVFTPSGLMFRTGEIFRAIHLSLSPEEKAANGITFNEETREVTIADSDTMKKLAFSRISAEEGVTCNII